MIPCYFCKTLNEPNIQKALFIYCDFICSNCKTAQCLYKENNNENYKLVNAERDCDPYYIRYLSGPNTTYIEESLIIYKGALDCPGIIYKGIINLKNIQYHFFNCPPNKLKQHIDMCKVFQ